MPEIKVFSIWKQVCELLIACVHWASDSLWSKSHTLNTLENDYMSIFKGILWIKAKKAKYYRQIFFFSLQMLGTL